MQTVKTTLFILICVALLGACGLKGPLYLPNENPVPQPADEQESAAGTDVVKDKEDDGDVEKKAAVAA